MKKILFFVACLLPLTMMAQDEATFQSDFAGMLEFNSGRVMSLAEAIPAEKYDWEPTEGVRSIGKSMLHIASGNYFFGMKLGAAPPEGVDIMNLETAVTGKDDIMATLKNSYAYVIEAGKGVADDSFAEELEFPNDMKFNKRMAMMIAMSHCGEHMGQLISFARMNDITPPWSEPAKEVTESGDDY